MLWEQIINGKYKKWINVCAPIHFIFEITEHTFDIIISIDWNKYKKIKTKIKEKSSINLDDHI